MIRLLIISLLLTTAFACSNSEEMDTGEIKTFRLLKNSFSKAPKQTLKIDARKIVSREMIDKFNVPILFVELESGQNGTLTKYPGTGVGITWLGKDGATITLDSGILIASRGMGDDLMGAEHSIPNWNSIKNGDRHSKKLFYLRLDNQLIEESWKCQMQIAEKTESVIVFGAQFETNVFYETCLSSDKEIKNVFYVDRKNIVRRSKQYHGKLIGYIFTERLDQ